MEDITQLIFQSLLDLLIQVSVYAIIVSIVILGAVHMFNIVVLNWILPPVFKNIKVWPWLVKFAKHKEEFKEWMNDKEARIAWQKQKRIQEDNDWFKTGMNGSKISNEGLRMNQYYLYKSVKSEESDTFSGTRLVQVPEENEYFILRLDGLNEHTKEKDKWFWACRKAVNVFANEVEVMYPQLADDIRKKWPYAE